MKSFKNPISVTKVILISVFVTLPTIYCCMLNITIDKLKSVIVDAKSLGDVCKILNLPKNGRTTKSLKSMINDNNIDIKHFTTEPEVLTCPICQKQFSVIKFKAKTGRTYCSLKCSNKKLRGNALEKKDEDLSGRKKYLRICFRHHEKKCVICGESNIVTVHHYDGNHFNDKPENLIPLCPTHHSYVHSKFKSLISDEIDSYRNKFIGGIV